MAISRFESKYMEWLFEIMQNGHFQMNERTGVATKRIPHLVMGIDCATEVPIIKSRKVFWNSAIEEAFWIFRDGSNDIHDLRPHIWDDWADENGIVQKTYGYQIKKFDQVNGMLSKLADDPSTRRALLNLWNCEDVPEMAITPCVYTSVWNVIDGKLNAMVHSRSCDITVGGIFNLFQYYSLVHMFARHLGVQPGLMTFTAADAHIYEDQFESTNKLFRQYQTLLLTGMWLESVRKVTAEDTFDGLNVEFRNWVKKTKDAAMEEMETQKAENDGMIDPSLLVQASQFEKVNMVLEENPNINPIEIYLTDPKLVIDNEDVPCFFDRKIEECHLVDYKSMPKIDFPVAK